MGLWAGVKHTLVLTASGSLFGFGRGLASIGGEDALESSYEDEESYQMEPWDLGDLVRVKMP
jgi:hypothetical protein